MIVKKTHIVKYITAAVVILLCLPVRGQQSQPFTQYLFNRFLLNPAAAGSDGYTSLGIIIKDQWSGFSKAPTNQTLIGQVRVPREGLFGTKMRGRNKGGFSPENVGLGVALFNDIRGPIRTTGGQFSYAYHLEDRYGQLSFGLSASLFQLHIDREKLELFDENDPMVYGNKLSSMIPDASFGVHYTTKDYYAGFAASNLFQSFLTFAKNRRSDYLRMERQYLLMGGYVYEVTKEWSLVPAAQVKFNEHGVGQMDLNVMVYYFDQFWGGLSYRTGGGGAAGGTSLMFGTRYRQYFFGYSFDYTLSSIRKYSYGSHELMASITFGINERFFRYKRRYEFQSSGQAGRR
jgi:type IX secretion system PorP/SprF family membrane protein